MSVTPITVSGRELYALMPAVYRARDDHGDLAWYLDACGSLLDRLRATLEQRLADGFAASPPEAAPAQSWLLPYFADLLDVRLVSPSDYGRRAEVARAIAWRQRKGTLTGIEEIAETVGGTEVEVQEGWRRLALTPRVDRHRLPAAAYGESGEPDPRNPLAASRHPALPAVTVAVAEVSRAVATDQADPRAKVSRFRGVPVAWRQIGPHGVPCFPGSFEDASRRTPDVRTPGPSRGHVHPRRLLLYVPPTTGFFPFNVVQLRWGERNQEQHRHHIADTTGEARVIDNPSRRRDSDVEPETVFVTTSPPQFGDASVTIRDLVFTETLHLTAGAVTLERVAARRLVVDRAGIAEPVVNARDCLFDELEAPDGLVRLEATTVMRKLSCRRLQASDCLFAGLVDLHPSPRDPRSCVRFSRLPAGVAAPLGKHLESASVTVAEPIFFAFVHCAREGGARLVDRFGDPGYGVLEPATPEAIQFGAEDGGELGADHHRATCLARAAILAKLEQYLPLGLEAVLVPDPRLLVEPPGIAP